MEEVKVAVNGTTYSARNDQTILSLCRDIGIDIPTLCSADCLDTRENCRICVVEVVGKARLVPACSTPIAPGMEIWTHSERVKRARKTVLELLLANHPEDCLICLKNGECEIQDLAKEFGIRERRFVGLKKEQGTDLSSRAIERDPNKCVLCGRCVEICSEKQDVGALDYHHRGFDTIIGPVSGELASSDCVFCGQCVLTCPTGALRERSALKNVWTAISDPGKKVAAVVSPAAKVGLFRAREPQTVDGLLVGALKTLGFDYVFDMSIANRLYLELLALEVKERKAGGGPPVIPAFCPAVMALVEKRYPKLLPFASEVKSPGQIAGTLAKLYLEQKEDLSPRDLFVVEIKPCTAAKEEANRTGSAQNGYQPVDGVLTTRELERMFLTSGIKEEKLEMKPFDEPFTNLYPCLGLLETAGGIVQALHEAGCRGELRKAKGLKAFRDIEEFADCDLLEVYACPVGCIGGGGANIHSFTEAKKHRVRLAALSIGEGEKPLEEAEKAYAQIKTDIVSEKSAVFYREKAGVGVRSRS